MRPHNTSQILRTSEPLSGGRVGRAGARGLVGAAGEDAGKTRRALPKTQLSKKMIQLTPKSLAFGGEACG